MNQGTELNSELLSADAQGKKHIPFAVFAVILIHIILFVVLLIAAGCRSSARARAKLKPEPLPERQMEHPANRYLQAGGNGAAAEPVEPAASLGAEPVVATEPVVEEERPVQAAAAPVSRPVSQAQPPGRKGAAPRPVAPSAASKREVQPEPGFYVVQPGDTVDRIARRHGTSIQAIKTANKIRGHIIHPGQKLIVQPQGAGEPSTAQLKAGKTKTSNEV